MRDGAIFYNESGSLKTALFSCRCQNKHYVKFCLSQRINDIATKLEESSEPGENITRRVARRWLTRNPEFVAQPILNVAFIETLSGLRLSED